MSHSTGSNRGLLSVTHLCSSTHLVVMVTLYWLPAPGEAFQDLLHLNAPFSPPALCLRSGMNLPHDSDISANLSLNEGPGLEQERCRAG